MRIYYVLKSRAGLVMSLVPEFELGLWNAWIITVLFYVATFTPLQIGKEKANRRGKGEPAWSELSKTHRLAILITHAGIIPFTIGYSIFLPLKLGTEWFYVGILISILGTVMSFMAGVSFATASLDEPMKGGLQHFKKPYILWHVLDVHRHRHSLRFLGFSAMCDDMDSLVALRGA